MGAYPKSARTQKFSQLRESHVWHRKNFELQRFGEGKQRLPPEEILLRASAFNGHVHAHWRRITVFRKSLFFAIYYNGKLYPQLINQEQNWKVLIDFINVIKFSGPSFITRRPVWIGKLHFLSASARISIVVLGSQNVALFT